MNDYNITVTVKLDLGHDEANAFGKQAYAAELLREVARTVEALRPTPYGDAGGLLVDGNGNTMGEWSLDGDLN